MDEWLSFYSALFNIHRSGVFSAIWLYVWCHVKLLPSRRMFCVHHTTMWPLSLRCHFIRSHTGQVHVCLVITCQLHFWQKDRYLLRATAVKRGWNGYRNKRQHPRVVPGEENSPAGPAGTNPGPCDHESGVLTTELCPRYDWCGVTIVSTVLSKDEFVTLHQIFFCVL